MQDIYTDDIGSGYPLVLVHGFMGSSEMWNFQKEHLKKNFRIISPALPGFGESYKAKSLDSINDMAKFVLTCVDEKKIKKFHLMGHSMGGMIVQEIAKISGDKINKLICFATGSIGEMPGRFESIEKSIARIKNEGIKESIKKIPPKWFIKGNKDKNYYLCEKAAANISEETSVNALLAMKKWRGINNLKNIKNKTLIIWGDQDKSYNFDQVDILIKNIPNSDLKVMKGCCHNAHLENPQKFNELVESFLK
tara:strand:- start:4265 stop:5017 length:753 start_codon:yes stop_codon:yes gene_type:complete